MKSGINHSWIKFAVALNIAMLMSMVVDAQPTINSITETNSIDCFGGNDGEITIEATGIGTLTYSLDNIDYSNITGVFSNLIAGGYEVWPKDDNGPISGNISILQPAELSYTLPDPLYFCDPNDGQITVNPTGGTANYDIDISGATAGIIDNDNILVASATYSSLAADVYTINVTDANGCPATQQVVTLFHDITAPIFTPLSLPVDYETSTEAYNAGNSLTPVNRVNDNTTQTVSGTTLQYDTEFSLLNYSNAYVTLTVTKMLLPYGITTTRYGFT